MYLLWYLYNSQWITFQKVQIFSECMLYLRDHYFYESCDWFVLLGFTAPSWCRRHRTDHNRILLHKPIVFIVFLVFFFHFEWRMHQCLIQIDFKRLKSFWNLESGWEVNKFFGCTCNIEGDVFKSSGWQKV